MSSIETDYLVVGAGACGMAFTDELITNCDAEVLMVDRRHRPGGHWNDGYGFLRLHQPSAYYGVNSRRLGNDRIDESGPNAGFYERASAAEVCDYYGRVLDEQMLSSGKVRFFGMSDYVGDGDGEHRFVSRLTGETTTVRVRRKLVDATYIQTTIPLNHKPAFEVDPGARVVIPAPARVTRRSWFWVHDHRRGQDRDGHLLLADRSRCRIRPHPLDPPTRTLDGRPEDRPAAEADGLVRRVVRGPDGSSGPSRERGRLPSAARGERADTCDWIPPWNPRSTAARP